jgi:hypothetical protein
MYIPITGESEPHLTMAIALKLVCRLDDTLAERYLLHQAADR